MVQEFPRLDHLTRRHDSESLFGSTSFSQYSLSEAHPRGFVDTVGWSTRLEHETSLSNALPLSYWATSWWHPAVFTNMVRNGNKCFTQQRSTSWSLCIWEATLHEQPGVHVSRLLICFFYFWSDFQFGKFKFQIQFSQFSIRRYFHAHPPLSSHTLHHSLVFNFPPKTQKISYLLSTARRNVFQARGAPPGRQVPWLRSGDYQGWSFYLETISRIREETSISVAKRNASRAGSFLYGRTL